MKRMKAENTIRYVLFTNKNAHIIKKMFTLLCTQIRYVNMTYVSYKHHLRNVKDGSVHASGVPFSNSCQNSKIIFNVTYPE